MLWDKFRKEFSCFKSHRRQKGKIKTQMDEKRSSAYLPQDIISRKKSNSNLKVHDNQKIQNRPVISFDKNTFYFQNLMTSPSSKQLSKEETNDQIIQQKYLIKGVAGKGTFGVVYIAWNKQTNEKIAIKKVLQDKRYKNRQLQILKEIDHPNLLKMREHFITYDKNKEYLHIVMDFFDYNLQQVIAKKILSEYTKKLLAYQLLRALQYLETKQIAHRDIKPQNILVDLSKKRAILCDLGSAKKLKKKEFNLAYICSRTYRAPELIFGATNYSTQIDMWSLGCVIAEMWNGCPLFSGTCQANQLIEITKLLGTPQESIVCQMNEEYDVNIYKNLKKMKGKPWQSIIKTDDVLLVDLLQKILQYSPIKRLTPTEAINHPYFHQISTHFEFN